MSDILGMFEEDSAVSAAEAVSTDGLKSVASLARRIRDTEDEIAKAETFLKQRKETLLQLTDQDLPAILEEMGLKSFTLDDGSKVEVKPLYGASIPAARKQEAFDWLRENGYDDLIKNNVICSFGRGEDEKAAEFAEAARERGLSPEQKQDVHAQTLKAWVRERVEGGDSFPMDLFGAFVGQRATIKKGK
jgi:uncharacterized small protein (DUF1192 family)